MKYLLLEEFLVFESVNQLATLFQFAFLGPFSSVEAALRIYYLQYILLPTP